MVFNFYINSQPDDNNKEDLENIMKSIENHFADWNDFFTYFGRTAGIPERNAKRIQQYFNDLRDDFVDIIRTYNDKIRKFADIQEEQIPDDFETEVINQMKSMMNFKKTEKKEKDLSMTDEKWNSRVERIEAFLSLEGNQEFLNSSEDIQDAVELIRMNIKRGNRDSTKRKNLYHQIRIEGMDWKVENYDTLETSWPVGHGQTSSLPVEVQGNLDTIAKMVEDAHIEFWNNNPIIQQVSIISDRNKELGGSPFDNALDFAAGKAFAVRTRWTKFFTDKRWNGELDLEAGFGITPPTVEESDDSGESDESDDS